MTDQHKEYRFETECPRCDAIADEVIEEWNDGHHEHHVQWIGCPHCGWFIESQSPTEKTESDDIY